jgi:ABC-type multidrug transport system ATPase subunit
VLFLDEPTTGLDPHSRNEVWAMVGELVADGTTVVLTTQYLEEADRLAARVAVVDGGRVIANDTPAALKGGLGSTVVELGFAEAAEAVRAHGLLAAAGVGAPELDTTSVRLAANNGALVLVDAMRTLDGGQVVPATVTVREPSLDDVFLALTGRHAEPEEAE